MRSARAQTDRERSLAFPGVAGLEKAKEALLLLAVDPGLKGVLIAGGPGTAKSSLARAFRSLLDDATPFVEAPLGVTEDQLIGSLDFERTFRTARRHLLPGLLARADGGVLLVDEINRLEPWQARTIAAALRREEVTVEREGVSAVLPSRFILVGAYDPREGPVGAGLLDVVGLHVRAEQLATRQERAALLERLLGLEGGAAARELSDLRARIRAGRRRLACITLDAAALRQLSVAAAEAGIEGHRVDWLAARAARAHAALAGRRRIEEEDLAAAIDMVVAPRARRGGAASEPRGDTVDSVTEALLEESAKESIDPVDFQEPAGVLERRSAALGRACLRAGKAGPPLRRPGPRGRYAGAVRNPRCGARVALESTLRAAALSAASRGDGRLPLRIGAEDLRFKRLRRRSGILVIFAVDASGSMAANRIAQAKGALLRLLRRAYVHRDRVALVSFGGRQAELRLPPSRSTERAVEAVRGLTVGGATPLADGLAEAARIAREASLAGEPVLLVLFTDGRANVSRRAGATGVWEEIAELGAEIRTLGIESVVIDTGREFAGSESERLALLLGGRYARLDRAAGAAAELVAGFAERLRARFRPAVAEG